MKEGQYQCDRCSKFVWSVVPIYSMQTVDDYGHSATHEDIERELTEFPNETTGPHEILTYWCIDCIRGK
jgi:hypothetical protein